MSNLFRAFFVEPLQREEQEREATSAEMEKLSTFVSHPYFERLTKDIQDLENRHRPKPGSEGEMIYAIGVRDGIEKARLHLESLVAFIQENHRE